MSNVLVVIASARKGRAADKVFEQVEKDLTARDGVTVTVADLSEINLPYFDNEQSPAAPDYVATNPSVIEWSDLVTKADAVVLLVAEYNHTINGILKNAIDSLKNEWTDKPVVAVGYGWTGASLSMITLNEVLPFLGTDFKQSPALLSFMKDINVDGTAIDDVSAAAKIKAAIDEIA